MPIPSPNHGTLQLPNDESRSLYYRSNTHKSNGPFCAFFAKRFLLMDSPEPFAIIILVLPPGVVCSSNRALPMLGTADGDAVSRCQVLGRAGSVHHGADQ